MDGKAIPMIAFPRVQATYIIYIFVSNTQIHTFAYVVKEVVSIQGAWTISGVGA